jgi:Na+/H+ antiporter NhaA
LFSKLCSTDTSIWRHVLCVRHWYDTDIHGYLNSITSTFFNYYYCVSVNIVIVFALHSCKVYIKNIYMIYGLVYWIGWLRSFIADYGVPFLVVVWTVVSFSVPRKIPSEIPRRLVAPLAWESTSLHHWTVIKVIHVELRPCLEFR